MPDGYGGFDWGAAHYCMAPTAASGNTTHVALSSTAAWIRRSDGTPLYFNGATYWSRRGLDATGDFCFALHLKSKTVYNGLADKKRRAGACASPARRRCSSRTTPVRST